MCWKSGVPGGLLGHSREKAQGVWVSRGGAGVPRSPGGSEFLEGRAPESNPGVCHTLTVLWSNQAQHFGEGTQLSVLGKEQDRAVGPLSLGHRVPISPPSPGCQGSSQLS